MKYKLISTDEFKLPNGVTEVDDTSNNLPLPYRKATYSDYCLVRGSYPPMFTEHRQVMHDENGQKGHGFKPLFNTTIEWFANVAFAIVWPNKWHSENGSIVFDDPIRYFRIGCQHDYEELTADECRKINVPHFGKCWHVHRCKLCNDVMSNDSSD